MDMAGEQRKSLKIHRQWHQALLGALSLFVVSSHALDCSGGDYTGGLVAYHHNATTNSFLLENGFVCLLVEPGKVAAMSADHTGAGAYGPNTLAAGGITLDREMANGAIFSSSELGPDDVAVSVALLSPQVAEVTMLGVCDSAKSPTVEERWTFRLEAGAHAFTFRRSGRLLGSESVGADSVVAVRRQFSMVPSAVFAFFGDEDATSNGTASVVQMKAAPAGSDFFPSVAPLARLYSLGGSGEEAGQVGNASIDLIFPQHSLRNSFMAQTALLNANGGGGGGGGGSSGNEDFEKSTMGGVGGKSGLTVLLSTSSGDPYWSGLQEVLFGGGEGSWLEHWGGGWEGVAPTPLPGPSNDTAAMSWSDVVVVGVNDRDFPILAANAGLPTSTQGDNLPSADLHALLTGTYASPAGCLCTHVNAVAEGVAVAQMATTIARPDRGYQGTYNYFDPDNYLSTSALVWSGDRFLQEQVRMVLERSGSFLTPEGQLPHHFEGLQPTYVALSGEIQTGPNVFWILSCLNYAKASANWRWLRGYMSTLRLASRFLFSLIDHDLPPPQASFQATPSSPAWAASAGATASTQEKAVGLAKVSGSLMIDVFLRSNYTSDTNAMLVGFFREFARAEAFVGNTTGASELSSLADAIAKAMNLYLWCAGEGDDDGGQGGDGGYCDSALLSAAKTTTGAGREEGGMPAKTTTKTTTATTTEKSGGGSSGDHFVTQWNQVNTDGEWLYRDFVDYDANLVSVAHGIPTDDPSGQGDDGGARAKRILSRVDSGGQCRASSTFVSERYYGPNDTAGGNTGDSWCAMGRIAWFDALARQAVGDADGFNSLVLNPLRAQVLRTTWMHERLSCGGAQQLNRTSMYFEYPSTVAMLLSRVRYGIELGYGGSVAVRPFGLEGDDKAASNKGEASDDDENDAFEVGAPFSASPSFSYHVNGVHIDFSATRVALDIDRTGYQGGADDDNDDNSGNSSVTLSPVAPSTAFDVAVPRLNQTFQAISDADGLLSFSVPMVSGHVVAVATSAV